jgi:hypothetical protein
LDKREGPPAAAGASLLFSNFDFLVSLFFVSASSPGVIPSEATRLFLAPGLWAPGRAVEEPLLALLSFVFSHPTTVITANARDFARLAQLRPFQWRMKTDPSS